MVWSNQDEILSKYSKINHLFLFFYNLFVAYAWACLWGFGFSIFVGSYATVNVWTIYLQILFMNSLTFDKFSFNARFQLWFQMDNNFAFALVKAPITTNKEPCLQIFFLGRPNSFTIWSPPFAAMISLSPAFITYL